MELDSFLENILRDLEQRQFYEKVAFASERLRTIENEVVRFDLFSKSIGAICQDPALNIGAVAYYFQESELGQEFIPDLLSLGVYNDGAKTTFIKNFIFGGVLDDKKVFANCVILLSKPAFEGLIKESNVFTQDFLIDEKRQTLINSYESRRHDGESPSASPEPVHREPVLRGGYRSC